MIIDKDNRQKMKIYSRMFPGNRESRDTMFKWMLDRRFNTPANYLVGYFSLRKISQSNTRGSII